ncbi:Peptide methionine sulfoxide reductase MsrB [Pandoraea cepalis]|uniref:peptide-methionine (R)-S-oxide reductase n=2 Tax=Burkholderiaceae TaxID=119060 RepID=A0A5E4XYG0_9BURK|nr:MULTISPECIES: peptide-methionine (R)-S-oxide reductase MsrB [Pandoraea]VVE09900.1 Peptide methionine sulfoxide reductase MsrB [Pandoraea cepalis]VVE41380.1 Peptide methionine sulfoxide reductase MsrB [Pandoraea cepalis]
MRLSDNPPRKPSRTHAAKAAPTPSRRAFLLSATAAAAAVAAGLVPRLMRPAHADDARRATDPEHFEVAYSDAEWRKRLTPAQYEILRQAGTERPYSSPLNDEHRAGTFACAGCALPLFSSRTKFDSHTGWPSFWMPLDHAVGTHTDSTFGMVRTEVHCRRCGGHLGHVFDDGPKPTGLRYCMNGLAMTFQPQPA